jgi:hypothetical protein
VFISRPSLWTNLGCKNKGQACVYLKRSKSLPVNLSLRLCNRRNSHHPFFKIVPHAIGRLRSLSIEGPLDDLEEIATPLSHPAPLLEKLSICAHYHAGSHPHPVLPPALFDGDISSLRSLRLEAIRTKLPWRNMVNLTSLKLWTTSRDGISIRELLDFFESAPHLREVDLHSATPTSGAQNGRLVLLACLEWHMVQRKKYQPSWLIHCHINPTRLALSLVNIG